MSDTVNHWFEGRCAQAFWDQKQALPYQDLLRDTGAWLDPRPGEHWLDLGCGGGQLAAQLWRLSGGRVGRILALDCAAVNEGAIARWRSRLSPSPAPDQFLFRAADFSVGLPELQANSCDGVVSGLAVSYAESRDPQDQAATPTPHTTVSCQKSRGSSSRAGDWCSRSMCPTRTTGASFGTRCAGACGFPTPGGC